MLQQVHRGCALFFRPLLTVRALAYDGWPAAKPGASTISTSISTSIATTGVITLIHASSFFVADQSRGFSSASERVDSGRGVAAFIILPTLSDHRARIAGTISTLASSPHQGHRVSAHAICTFCSLFHGYFCPFSFPICNTLALFFFFPRPSAPWRAGQPLSSGVLFSPVHVLD